MRRIISVSAVLLFLTFFSSSVLFAQGTDKTLEPQPVPPGVQIDPGPFDPPFIKPDMYPPPMNPTGLFELALFDKKGGAQIAGKITLDEIDKANLSQFSMIIPGKDVVLAGIVDEKWEYKKICSDTYPRPLPGGMYKSEGSSQSTTGSTGIIAPDDMPQYCPPQYVQTFTWVTPTVENLPNGIKVNLSVSPKTDKTQESLLFLYRTPSYTNAFLTNHSYHFDTVKLPLSYTTVQVGVLVRDGLYLRGSAGYTNMGGYLPSFRAIEKAKNLKEEENQELSNLSNEIAYQGMVRRGDSDMTPDSSFSVSGVYGTNVMALYVKEIFLGILVIIAVIGAIIMGVKKFFKNNIHLKTILITTIFTVIIGAFFIAFVFLLLYYLGATTGLGIRPGY